MAEKLIYDTGALYNQHMGEDDQRRFGEFYSKLFSSYSINTIHDCSVGAGGSTIPLSKLGYTVSGSDLNENLLNRAKQNFWSAGFSPELFIADFRDIDKSLSQSVDCMISTGNSLPHVDSIGIGSFFRSAAKCLKDGGLLFFDIRNWDAIAQERPIIHAIDPKVMTADEHRSVYLLFNWHDDGSVTFSFAASVDKNGKHESMDIIKCPAYYPLLKNDIVHSLADSGYRLLQFIDMDSVWLASGMEKEKTGVFENDFPNIQWYGVLAQKIVININIH